MPSIIITNFIAIILLSVSDEYQFSFVISVPAKWQNLKSCSGKVAQGGHTRYLETPPLPYTPLLRSIIS